MNADLESGTAAKEGDPSASRPTQNGGSATDARSPPEDLPAKRDASGGKILFATIAYGALRLVTYLDKLAVAAAELSDSKLPFENIADRILAKTPNSADIKSFYETEELSFNFQVYHGVTYLCVCLRDYPRRLVFDYLRQVQLKFEERFSGADELTVRKASRVDELNSAFRGTLKAITRAYSTRKDKITQVQGEVEEVSAMMRRNIEDTLERGERLDNLVEQAEDLRGTASAFSRQSRSLKQRMCQKQAAAATCVIILVLLIIVGVVLAVVLSTRNRGGG